MIKNDGTIHTRQGYLSEYPKPSHFIVHISDTHLTAADTGLYGSTVFSDRYLKKLFRKLEIADMKPDAIVFTGDIADLGEPEAYQKVKAIVESSLVKLGNPEVIWVMGNHDIRNNFRVELLNLAPSLETIDSVHMVDGLRIIVLDSTVHGAHYGEITADQLTWLANILEVEAPHGTILAMHHPPVPAVIESAISVELTDQKKLAEVIRNSDIRSIIAGHLHYSTSATFAGIPVSVASATCYTQDLNVHAGGLRARDGAQAYNLVHVYEETIVHSVVPLGNSHTIKKRSPKQILQELVESGFTGFPETT